MAVGLYPCNRSIKGFALAAIGILSVVAVEGGCILFAQRPGRVGKGLLVAGAESIDKLVENRLDVVGMTRNLEQRNGVGSIAHESCLVDVESYAHDGAGKSGAAQYIFDEDAGYLLVLPVDVVGPFDGEACGIAAEQVGHGQRNGLREQKLLVGRDVFGAQQQAEGKVLARFRFPRVTPLSTSGPLGIGVDDIALGQVPVGIELLQIGVGRSGFDQVVFSENYLFGFHCVCR